MSEKKFLKLGICAGGTGGHVFPALAVAQEWKNLGGDVIFFTTGRQTEEAVKKFHGAKIFTLSSSPIAGKSIWEKLKGTFKTLMGIFEAITIIRKENIQFILGLGGYASFPAIFAAFILKIPRAVFEANAVPGFANKILFRISNIIFINFEGVKTPHDKKVIRSGMPVREEFEKIEKGKENDPPFILVTGGSQGSSSLNRHVPEALKILHRLKINFKVIHQCGRGKLEEVRKFYKDLPVDVELIEFIENMAEVLSRVDVVISRSGASFLSELASAGVPAILIPFPYAAGNHQLANAQYFEREGAALVVEEGEGLAERIAEALGRLLQDEDMRKEMSLRSKSLASRNSAKIIAKTIWDSLEGENVRKS